MLRATGRAVVRCDGASLRRRGVLLGFPGERRIGLQRTPSFYHRVPFLVASHASSLGDSRQSDLDPKLGPRSTRPYPLLFSVQITLVGTTALELTFSRTSERDITETVIHSQALEKFKHKLDKIVKFV